MSDLPLLDYAFSTDPAPVPVSTAQVINQARVNISVSAHTPVYCDRIVVAVPVGKDAASLFGKSPAGSTNTNKWAVVTKLQQGSALWAGLDANQDYATFTYECVTSADYLIAYNLVYGVFGEVNGVVGEVDIQIQENSGTTADPATFTQKVGRFPLRKEWPEFYLKNLVATTPANPTVPATEFANGAPIRLAWESNGTYFQLFTKGQSKPTYSGTATTCTLPGGVSSDTTFVLAASMTGSPGQDSPQGGYEPIYLYDSLAVSVSNPVLTPTSVTVSGPLGVTGTTTLGTTQTGTLTSASATVNGSLGAGTLNVNGSATVGQANVLGGMRVTGTSTLNGTTVNGTLNGTGAASLNNLTVRGLSGSSGRVALLGTGTLLAQGTSVAQTGVYAQTDGFALAQVLTPGNNGKSSFAYGHINTVGTWFQVLGGTVGSFGANWNSVMNNNPNAITVPIPAGTYWWYSAGNAGGNQLDSPIQIWWFPMGTGASSTQTFRILADDELVDVPPPPVVPDFGAFFDRAEETSAAARGFVDRLAEVLDASLADESRADLARLLRRL